MNRLVIIGNGFDLAHGLPTRYQDFLNFYWLNVISSLREKGEYNDSLVKITLPFKFLAYNEKKFLNQLNDYFSLCEYLGEFNFFIEINSFFNKISEINSLVNWVDIENYYYKLVLHTANIKEDSSFGNIKSIKELNQQFNDVKRVFENYLNEEVVKKYSYNEILSNDFKVILKDVVIEKNQESNLFDELTLKGRNSIKDFFEEKKPLDNHIYLNLTTHFLSFNYTDTVSAYYLINGERGTLNEIHGRLNSEDNPINFGFGDEMDQNYQKIERLDDNEYLKNFKSFQYLHTSNYKQLLDLIDSDIFQVYIMGHSCGLSDRTLLNTIFEHENCVSIKVFYHQWKNKSTEKLEDNYTEITQNISRHFNDKKLMREKVVNKTLCEPMPQVKLNQIES